MTTSGDLRERFAFDTRTTTSDGLGNEQGAWAEQFTIAAQRAYLRGGESVMASRLEGRSPALITIRSSIATRAITTDWRCRDVRTGEEFAIKAVTPRQHKDFIDIVVERGVAHG